MFNEPVVYVDIETTGGSYRSSRIIEFAAIRVENGEVTETFTSLINPGSPILSHISRLTGITTNDVQEQPFFEEIAEDIRSILTGAIFVAHNVRFDYSFIKRQLEICNINYNPKMLCSVRMSRALYPEYKSHKLQSIIERFNISVNARHRAHDDAEAVRKFLEIAYDQHGSETFHEAVTRQFKHRSLPPNLPSDAFLTIPDKPGVYTFSDNAGMPIYIGKSVSLRKRVMSHFAQDTKIDKEMKLSLSTHNISFIETGSELEALLLESQMIKEKLPIHNQMLRRVKKMYVVKVSENQYGYLQATLDFVETGDINNLEKVYGAYASKMKAKSSLENLQKNYGLCPKLLGLEKSSDACFKYQLKKCNGACIQKEPADLYNTKFEIAFENNRIKDWPFSNPVVITPTTSSSAKNLVVDNWNVIGELSKEEGCSTFYKPWKTGFDVDTYKILYSYISKKSKEFKLSPISYAQLESLN